MRKLLIASVSVLALGFGAAQAEETESEEFGAAAGGTTGAIAGAVVGGPVGAIVGGIAGAVLGAATAVPEPAVQYVVANPVEPVAIEGELAAGATIPEGVTLTPIPDHPEFAYVYTTERPVIVRADTREVVYSPGYILPRQTVTYVESNPVDPVVIEGEIAVGATVPAEVELREIPDSPRYSYVYLDRGPAIVETDSRTVVWVR
jgi:hypothetical protein